MKFHVTAGLEVKPCKCKNVCRVKHGSYESEEEARAAVARLKSPTVVEPTTDEVEADELTFSDKIEIPEPDPIEELYVETPPEVVDKVEQVQRRSAYFDDDREFLKGDDEVLSVGPDAALIDQMENVVSWRIDNFYDEDGKRRNRLALRADPPMFRVEASDGSVAEFVLTKNLSITLSEAFEDVKRGYYGVNAKKNTTLQGEPRSKVEEARQWALSNPMKAVGLAVLLVLFVVTAFIL